MLCDNLIVHYPFVDRGETILKANNALHEMVASTLKAIFILGGMVTDKRI